MKIYPDIIAALIVTCLTGLVCIHGRPADPVNLRAVAHRQSDPDALFELDLRIAALVNWPVDGYVPDPEYPDVTGPSFYGWWWYRWYILHELMPGQRVYCNVALPPFSANLELASQAAFLAGYVPPYEPNDPEEMCHLILGDE